MRSLGTSLSPKWVVEKLDEHIVGQCAAKRILAIAIQNRSRLLRLEDDSMRRNIRPCNVILTGRTGTGKTALISCASSLHGFPFVKSDATKFTEVGYVGRDVESVVQDLVDKAILMERNFRRSKLDSESIVSSAEKKVAFAVISKQNLPSSDEVISDIVKKIRSHELDDLLIEIDVPLEDDSRQSRGINLDLIGSGGGSVGNNYPSATVGVIPFNEIFKVFSSENRRVKRLKVKDAIKALSDIKMVELDNDDIISTAINNVESNGIVLIDEIDKIISHPGSQGRGDVSREGVQRDLIPLVEGTVVTTKHGPVKTDHVLFVVAGAFHTSKPSDLLPELRGRFPIEAQMKSLTTEDFVKILTIPQYNMIRQVISMLSVDNSVITFTDDGILAIAEAATRLNSLFEDVGARRLFGVLEKVIEEISFSSYDGKLKEEFVIDKAYVDSMLLSEFAKASSKKEDFVI